MPADPYKYFRVEARELLEQLGQGALDLEKGVPSPDLIARVLRLAHTLKGAARVVKQPQIADHAHELEDLFAAIRDSKGRTSQEQIDRALMLLDQIGVRVGALAPEPDTQAEMHAGRQAQEPIHTFRPELADLEMLVSGVAEAQSLVGGLRPRLEQVDRIRHLIDLVDTQLVRLRGREAATPGDRSATEKTRSMIEELRGRFSALERGIAYGIDEMERELRQVSDTAARLRLVPASAMFRFLERAARDVAQVLGKRVTFEGRGGDVGVDSRILTIVQGALLQLVRNAVAHGIEPGGSERIAAGKPSDGHVSVSVSRRGTSVSFVCSDDGRGIDFDAVRRTLHRKGLIATERQTLDADALLRLLLKGGISTSGTITDVAGRGIGLDVVREAAERLSGGVSIRSEPSHGTTVEIVVPFSIASFPALLVETAGVPAAIPLDAVRRTMRVTERDIVETPHGDSVLDDGRSVPLVSLVRVIRPAEHHTRPTGALSAFVVEAGEGAAAFVVDRVVGTGTVVLRPLPDLAPATPVIVGASFDAGGQPRLVLDPAAVVAEAQRVAAERETPAARPSILVVDDSLTTRMLEQSILESAGYDVSLAVSGEEGLEKARSGKYSLFLVDIEMPGIDGFTFIEQVRSDPMLRDIPSILVTSRASAEDRRRGRDVGAQGYIVKSDFDQGTLLEHIRTLVQ
jgi:two-component system chemotaxis sensor kinase CheA